MANFIVKFYCTIIFSEKIISPIHTIIIALLSFAISNKYAIIIYTIGYWYTFIVISIGIISSIIGSLATIYNNDDHFTFCILFLAPIGIALYYIALYWFSLFVIGVIIIPLINLLHIIK
jgi:hypothetical protein